MVCRRRRRGGVVWCEIGDEDGIEFFFFFFS
jgi:hypothetical protein